MQYLYTCLQICSLAKDSHSLSLTTLLRKKNSLSQSKNYKVISIAGLKKFGRPYIRSISSNFSSKSSRVPADNFSSPQFFGSSFSEARVWSMNPIVLIGSAMGIIPVMSDTIPRLAAGFICEGWHVAGNRKLRSKGTQKQM